MDVVSCFEKRAQRPNAVGEKGLQKVIGDGYYIPTVDLHGWV
jgi:hypothetical protein